MAGLSKVIDGCAYHPGGDAMGFPFEGMPVLLEQDRMTVYGADTEDKASRVVDWLKQKITELSGQGDTIGRGR